MSKSVEEQAKKYLEAPTRGLWNWTADEDGVQWRNGQLIAFTAEIREVLKHQMARKAQGLPRRFGALLLLIAATRDSWNSEANRNWRRDQLERIIRVKSQTLLNEVMDALDGINDLTPELRASLTAKQTLVDVVFEGSSRTSVEVGIEILRLLNPGHREILSGSGGRGSENILIDDLVALHKGLVHVDADKLSLQQQTGVDEIPVAELLELPDDPSPSELFAELESDSELYVLGRAARQLHSVLSLPQPSFLESELQQGGVSDIANRGPLDRLLLSELAHDDLTLAVRVAVNEAMYLRRESPPQNQQRRQIIVLDCGLRSWGMPRLIGAAVGMALVARAGDSVEPSVFSANKDQLEAVSLSNREDIVEHLKTLRTELDLTDSLPTIDQLISDSESECDLVLVTNDATAESSSLSIAINRSNLLANAKLSRLFVGSVDHCGETKLIEVNQLGRKPIRQLTLDSNRLTENAPARKHRINGADHLPAFFGLDQMPLLMSYNHAKQDFVWPVGPNRMILLTGDGRLLYFNSPNFGGQQLSDRIQAAKVWWYSKRSTNGVWSAVIGHDQRGDFRLISYTTSSKEISDLPLDISGQPVGFCSHQGTLFVIYRDQVAIVDRESGVVGKAVKIPNNSWKSGRFFANEKKFHALSTDGFVPVLEKIKLPWTRAEFASSMLHVYECESIEGPIVVCPMLGEIRFLASEKTVMFETDRTMKNLHGLSVASYDPISGSICLLSEQSYRFLIVDVMTGKVKAQSYPTSFIQERVKHLTHHQHQLRRRFPSITVLEDGTLRLASRNQPRLEFGIRNKVILLEEAPVRQGKLRKQSFQRARRPETIRYELQVARWEDGSEAWLDGRGLLHLRSSNTDIPELTITLSHGPCAGWCSDGELFGDSFYIGVLETNKSLESALEIMKLFGQHIVKSC